MRQEKAQELIQRAQKYIGSEITLQSKFIQENRTETKIYIFSDIVMGKFTTQISTDPTYKEIDISLLSAKLEDKNNKGQYVFESLEKILELLERQ